MQEDYYGDHYEEDEGRLGFVISAEEHRRIHLERAFQLDQFRQRNPDIPPDQLENQFNRLREVITTLPPDLANDATAYRQKLVESGLSDTLIQQQMNDLAYLHAQRSVSATTRDRATSPATESSQLLPATQEHGGVQEETPTGQGQESQLSATVSIPISALEVVTGASETVFELSQAEIQHARVHPATGFLRIEVLRLGGPA